MLKPPAANMPGMTDTLDFVRNLWGSMNIPGANLSGMGTPPLSADELDKRIADLKAVESWLNMNITMLRGTIQSMEVQRATLATLKSMGASMAEVMRQSGVSADKMAGTPFGPFFGQPPAQAAPGAGGGAAQPGAGSPAQDPATAAAAGMPAAIAWWNMLQEQFTQAVTTAMTPVDGAAKAEPQGASAATQQQQQAQQAQQAQQQPRAESPASGNGKERGSKPKADKT
jgi:hypothetical protein